MKRSTILAMLLVGGMLCRTGFLFAQFYPGYGYGGWGGYNGAAALVGADYQQATAMQLKSQSRQAGQEASMNQNAVVQSGIRNTLSSQATARSDAIAAQQQQTQDWWFQHQTRQAAQRQPAGNATAAGMTMTSAGDNFAPPGPPPPATTDIIPWPALLQERCFASEREKIESPYRRTPPKLSTPNAADYGQMAAAVEDMKAVLQWRASEGVNPNDFNAAKDFLDRLGSELAARARAGKV